MKKIELKKYGPIISDKKLGEELYNLINDSLKDQQTIELDMTGIISMATFCAKQIFGRLYLNLSPEVFFDRIELKNTTDDLKLIIKIGIQNAIEENQTN